MQDASAGRVVLHADADAFFCQVHRLVVEPHLNVPGAPPPLAVQQEGGVIAADHAARALGVTKFMESREADALLRPAGGRVVSVFAEPAPGGSGGRVVSYRPYRETSAAMARVLRGAAAAFFASSSSASSGGGNGGGGGGAAPQNQQQQRSAAAAAVVFEKASIDEAFLEPPPPMVAANDNDGGEQEEEHNQQQQQRQQHEAAMCRGRELADALRSAARRELGLVLSVGVARNKLLAKLASRAAKPDGVFVVCGQGAELALLDATPVGKLPGMGGGVARAVARAAARGRGGANGAGGAGGGGGIGSPGPTSSSPSASPSSSRLETAGDVRRRFAGDASALAAATGLDPQAAARLCAYARGDDGGAPVVDRGPPRSLGAQHTLTPITVLEKMLPLALSAATCPGGDVRPLLPPLPPRDSDAYRSAAAAMAAAMASAAEQEEQRQAGEGGANGGGGGGSRSPGASPSKAAAAAAAAAANFSWQGPRVGNYTLLRHDAPGSSARMRRVLEGMCRDLLVRVLTDRRDEGRWPRKLRVGVSALDPALSAAKPPSAAARGGKGGSGGAPAWGPCAGHATRTGEFPPERLADAPLSLARSGSAVAMAEEGERSVPVPPALLSAVAGAALALAEGLLSARCRYGTPVFALQVAATAFGAEEGPRKQQGIGRYYKAVGAPKRARGEEGDGGTSAGSSGSGSAGERSGGETDEEEDDDGEEGEEQAARAGDKRRSPAKERQQQQAPQPPQPQPQPQPQLPVTLLRLPLVKPIVLKPQAAQQEAASQEPSSQEPSPGRARDLETAVVAAAAASTPPRARQQPQRPAPFVPPPPPPPRPPAPGIRLTDVLRSLSRPAGENDDGSGDGGDDANERALESALAAAGARRVLPRAAI